MTNDQTDSANEIQESDLDDVQGGLTMQRIEAAKLDKVEIASGAGVSPFQTVRPSLLREQLDEKVGRAGATPTPHP